MSRCLLFALVVPALFLACTPATVTHVVDGDTVDVVITGPDPEGSLVEGTAYRVRLIGIDAPEVDGETGAQLARDKQILQDRLNWILGKGNTLLEAKLRRQIEELERQIKQLGCYGPEASAFVKGLLEGKPVWLDMDVSNTDQYNRLLRYVWTELYPSRDGLELVNEEIVRAGYARVSTYPADVRYVDRLAAAEQYARDNHLGLWGACP